MACKREGIVRHFARNYIVEQLELNGCHSLAERLRLQCARASSNCCDDEDAEEILHKIAQQLTRERGEHFELLCANLELRVDNVPAVYSRVVQEMLVADVHWGSVVTLVSFTGVLVVYLAQHGLEEQVPHTLEQMDSIIHDRVLPWITLKGGWVSANVFFMFVTVVLQSALWKYFDESVIKPTALVFGVGTLVTLGIGGMYGLKKIGIL